MDFEALDAEWSRTASEEAAVLKRLREAAQADPVGALKWMRSKAPRDRYSYLELLVPQARRHALHNDTQFAKLRDTTLAFLVRAEFICFDNDPECGPTLPHRHMFAAAKELAFLNDALREVEYLQKIKADHEGRAKPVAEPSDLIADVLINKLEIKLRETDEGGKTVPEEAGERPA